jgi:hypothetical protein
MKFFLLLAIGALTGCQVPDIAQNLEGVSRPLSTSGSLEKFIAKLENAIREEDFDQFTKLVNFPLEVRGALDGDIKYISSENTKRFFIKFLSESSGNRKLDWSINPASGELYTIDNHTKKMDLIEHMKNFKYDGLMAENSVTIGSLVISKTSEGWRVIALYSDMFGNSR